MSLKDRISEDIKSAMKAKDKVRLNRPQHQESHH